MKTLPLKTSISHDRQSYVDEAILARPVSSPSAIECAVARAFGRVVPVPESITIGHERVRLRWMTPDGKGGLKPRSEP